MKLYTRTGDTGDTGLFGGTRVKKSHARVCAYGAVDEANAALGLVRAAADLPVELHEHLERLMSDLFSAGAELATPPPRQGKRGARLTTQIDEGRVAELEGLIDQATAATPPLTSFVLPTGTDAAARLHVARTVVRRAEREVVRLAAQRVRVRAELLAYLNRLSDLLFAWARLCNARAGRGDVAWKA
ncbi:MAG: cob(I)yrinic acid a,c-diamide adenosyltransferase [Deltaproteobacteria bacterium]|nr:cob(I)yrinic acid a,c-diamide adenosyltransferase [Deltaproteobacteria bacterium]